MKNITASLLSASVLICAASAADAKQAWPNWYLGLHGSMAFVGEQDIENNATASSFEQDTGFGYGAEIGYRLPVATGEWSNMRLELQWHHQRADIDSVTTPLGSLASGGQVRANAGMGNVFYDAVTSMPSWRPYVGVGIGFAQLNLQNTNAATDKDSVFAWNVMAGLGYTPEMMPFTELQFGYRYFATGEGSFAFADGSTFDMSYDSHNLEAGIKFLF